MTRPTKWVLTLFLLLTTLSFLSFEAVTCFRLIPLLNYGTTVVMIKKTSSLREISRQLRDEGVISAPWKLEFLTRLLRKQSKLRQGEFRFDVPSTPYHALQTLLSGKLVLHKVVFPEGTNMTEMSYGLSGEGLVELEKFQSMLTDPTLLTRFEIPGKSFEGFLFPDTYYFSRTDGELKILETMVGRFKQNIKQDAQVKAAAMGLSLLQWVTLASIIEKETGVGGERTLVASVFMNRLNKHMRLQSDPTVIYGIPNFNGNITKKDLQTPTPYNTYTQQGLPPGPIANPGAAALHAAVHPESTNYFYFVARQDGTHVFAATYDEHRKNVAFYQLGKQKTVHAN